MGGRGGTAVTMCSWAFCSLASWAAMCSAWVAGSEPSTAARIVLNMGVCWESLLMKVRAGLYLVVGYPCFLGGFSGVCGALCWLLSVCARARGGRECSRRRHDSTFFGLFIGSEAFYGLLGGGGGRRAVVGVWCWRCVLVLVQARRRTAFSAYLCILTL